MEPPDESTDDRKVYVSRLPLEWTEDQLLEHFRDCFGPVESVSIMWNKVENCSRGFGFVIFENESDRANAIAQGSLHVKKRNIQIRAVKREEEMQGRGRDSGICYLWQKHSCVKGSECRFAHEGDGGCIKPSAEGQGKKKCLSFKSKGKCSKGDSCPFLHELSANKEKVISTKFTSEDKICHSFKKKGTCRKGSSCKFSHEVASATDDIKTDHGSNVADGVTFKKRRIDGSYLVEARKKSKS